MGVVPVGVRASPMTGDVRDGPACGISHDNCNRNEGTRRPRSSTSSGAARLPRKRFTGKLPVVHLPDFARPTVTAGLASIAAHGWVPCLTRLGRIFHSRMPCLAPWTSLPETWRLDEPLRISLIFSQCRGQPYSPASTRCHRCSTSPSVTNDFYIAPFLMATWLFFGDLHRDQIPA